MIEHIVLETESVRKMRWVSQISQQGQCPSGDSEGMLV